MAYKTHLTGNIFHDGACSLGDGAELTIASGVITVVHGFYRVDTEANAATDDLDTITTAAALHGTLLVLRAENTARTVVVKNATGNIRCGADFSLDNTLDTITFIYDAVLSVWLKISSADNGA